MIEKMDRKRFVIKSHESLAKEDSSYWQSASVAERLRTMMWLRESFYGSEATTGRLQRLYQIVKRE